MKKHAIIPIFIPHLGCPNDCVFCNQRKITARTEVPSASDVRRTVEEWLTTLEPRHLKNGGTIEEIEASFYGGSFTGLPIEDQTMYLSVAKEFLDAGRIDSVHLSTRPDYIDDKILTNLRNYGVEAIEIGVQSFDDEVLKASNRGHDSSTVYRAAEMIHDYGFRLGIQLMIGLPGDSMESCIYSARETARLKPELARLYPTIVLDDTRLLEMYNEGTYKALSRDEAVARTLAMYRILDDAGIYIMRVGLKSTDIIGDGGAINGGTYHPAFRQLVEGRLMRELLEEMLTERSKGEELRSVTVYSNQAWFSNLIGNRAENRMYFEEHYPEIRIRYAVDDTLSDKELRVTYNTERD